MEIMELNEEITEKSDRKFLQEKLDYVNKEIAKRLDKLDNLFSNKKLKEARETINQLHYLKRTKTILNGKFENS